VAITEDTLLIRRAMAYVVELYREMTEENGAPTLGTQNQVVEFILANPELCLAVSRWLEPPRLRRQRPARHWACPTTAHISALAPICDR
jgi:hypothetical protein